MWLPCKAHWHAYGIASQLVWLIFAATFSFIQVRESLYTKDASSCLGKCKCININGCLLSLYMVS